MGSSVLVSVLGAIILQCAQSAVLSFAPGNVSDLSSDVQAPLNRDSRYDKWVDPGRILYRFDDHAYSAEEKNLIMKAMDQVGQDMNHCINFKEYNPDADAGWDNIYISKTLNDGSVPPTCFSFYGRVLRAAGQGQKMAIHAGLNGCMDSQREVMKIMVNVLGLRNEYNRPDRDQFIKVYPESLQPELRHSNLLTAYNASQVDTVNRAFDYNSITIPVFNKYGIENSTVFEFPVNHSLPHLDRLSLDDCLGLSWMYGCEAKKCIDPYGQPTPIVKEEAAVPEIKNDKILIELNATAASVLTSSFSSPEANQSSAEAVPSSSAASLVASSTPSSSEASSVSTELVVNTSTSSEASSPATEMIFTSSPQTVPESSATMLVTLATSAPPLNISLSDVIVPRKGADLPVTEAPMLINTEVSVSVSSSELPTTQAAPVSSSEDTTASPQLKFVFVANQTASENATALSVVIAVVNTSDVSVELHPNATEVTPVAPVVSASPLSSGVSSSVASVVSALPLDSKVSSSATAETSSRPPVAPEETLSATATHPMVKVSVVAGEQVQELLAKEGLNATALDSNNVVSFQNGANNSVSSGVIDSIGSPVIL